MRKSIIGFLGVVIAIVGAPAIADEVDVHSPLLASLTTGGAPHQSPRPDRLEAALLCFRTGEQVSGLNKICFYDCAGSAAAITIKSFELCPLTIKR